MKLELIVVVAMVLVTIGSTSMLPTTIDCTIDFNCLDDDNCTNCSFYINCEPITLSETVQESCQCNDDTCMYTCNQTYIATNLQCTQQLNETSDVEKLIAQLTDCSGGEGKGLLCWILVGFGCVVTVLLVIIMLLCVAITCLLARGVKKYKYSPGHTELPSRPGTDQSQNQQQQEQQQQENRTEERQSPRRQDTQQTNFYHILDPQYAIVEQNAEPVQYSEPERLMKGNAKISEQEKSHKTSVSQSPGLKPSPEGMNEGIRGVLYDELVGPGHKSGSVENLVGAKSPPVPSSSSSLLSPSSMPKYSCLDNKGDSSAQEQANELIPLYSLPDMSKKKEARQTVKESGMSSRQTTMSPEIGPEVMRSTRKSPSPPPPQLPPKPGQTQQQQQQNEPEIQHHQQQRREEYYEEEEATYDEVSSKPLQAVMKPISTTSNQYQQRKFPRSHSLEGMVSSGSSQGGVGVGGNSRGAQKDVYDMDLRMLYDEPIASLNLLASTTTAKSPPQHQQHRGAMEEEEDRLGYFSVS